MAMAADIENPWENAAADPEWTEAQKNQGSGGGERATINFSLDQRDPDDTFGPQDDEIEEELANKLVRYLVNSWHLTDAVAGLTMTVYGIVLHLQSSSQQLPKALFRTLVILGCLSMLRACAGFYSIYRDSFARLGMLFSAYMSAVWSVVLFVLSMIALGIRNKIPTYLINHEHELLINYAVVHFFRDHVHFVWITLLVISVFELFRFISLVNYRGFMLDEDELALQLLPQSSVRHQQRKPWWWSKPSNRAEDGMADPLLDRGGPAWATTNNRSYRMDEGLGSGTTRRSIWFSVFGRRADDNDRDNASVDFASVQEEWASRSEADPFWWSRDEGEAKTKS